MDRNQKPFESATPTTTGTPAGTATGGTPASGPHFPPDTSNRDMSDTTQRRSSGSGSSFVGHVPGSDVEAGDRKSSFGSTVQREAHMVEADQKPAPMASAGQKMGEFADALRGRAPEGKMGEVVQGAASALERGGHYFTAANMDTMRGDMESLIRRYPMQSLAIGLGVGFLVARALRR